MKKILLYICVVVILFSSIGGTVQNVYSADYPTEPNQFSELPRPAGGHPRVLVNSSMLPELRERIKHPSFKKIMDNYGVLIDKDVDGVLPEFTPPPPAVPGEPNSNAVKRTNIDNSVLNVMKACAFTYLTGGDEAVGRKAVDIAVNIAKTIDYMKDGTPTDIFYVSQQTGVVILLESVVYDWCYSLLTDLDKQVIIDCLDDLVRNSLEFPYPIDRDYYSVMVGHLNNYVTHNFKLAMGIALYDELPEYYNDVIDFEVNQVIPALNYSLDSEIEFDGISYGEVRMNVYAAMAEILKAAGIDLVSPKIGKVADRYIYSRRPDGFHMTQGDDFGGESTNLWTRTITGSFINMISGSVYGNELAMYEYKKQGEKFEGPMMQDLYFLCWYNPNAEYISIYDAPLSRYFPSPYGSMIARTGWDEGKDSNAMIAVMDIGEITTRNHQHNDAGAFQIYYKGYLAIDSGMYSSKLPDGTYQEYNSPHTQNYHKQSVAHNTVLIDDPSSPENSPGGHQTYTDLHPASLEEWKSNPLFHRGKTLSHSMGDDEQFPDYTYIKGDLTASYGLSRTKDYTRSMVFLNFKDETYPGALVVYDNIDTPNPDAKKTFLLHTINEPTINGNEYVNTVTGNDYNGKLVTNTLLPKLEDLNARKVGGEGNEFTDGTGVNYPALPNNSLSYYAAEAGKWRIELSPKTPANSTRFLNVLQAMDADNGPEPQEAYYNETDDYAGTVISDRAVFFAKEFGNIENNATITFSGDSDTEYKILVTDLSEGFWTAVKEGETASVQYEVKKDENCLYFVGKPGTYTLTKSEAEAFPVADKVPSKSAARDIKLYFDGENIPLDVAPQMINDITMVPVRKIFEALEMNVEWDDAVSKVTAKNDNLTIEIIKDSAAAKVNGSDVIMDYPATMTNDRILVPLQFISDSAGCYVNWNDLDKNVEISRTIPEVLPEFVKIPLPEITPVPQDELQELIPVASTASQNANEIFNMFDGEIVRDNNWFGRDDGVYAQFDFGKEVRLDRVDVAIVSGDARQLRMTFYVSNDGNRWTPIYGGDASGKTLELESYNLEPVTMRYFRIVGFGSPDTGSPWTSITEMKLWGKKE